MPPSYNGERPIISSYCCLLFSFSSCLSWDQMFLMFMLELWWDLTTNLKNISPGADPPFVLYVVCWVFWWLLRFNFLDDMWPCKSSAPPQHRANPDRRQHLGGLAELHTAASHCAVAARATPKLIDLVWQSSTAVANEGAGPMKATRCNTWGSHDESSNHGKPEN